MLNELEIDHVGYAVRDMRKALAAFDALGYRFDEIIDDADRNLKICFGEKDGYRIELLARMGAGDSPVENWLRKVGPTPYHICYRSRDFEKDIEMMNWWGYRLIIPPAPAVAFGGRRVAFLIHLNIGMIEILEA